MIFIRNIGASITRCVSITVSSITLCRFDCVSSAHFTKISISIVTSITNWNKKMHSCTNKCYQLYSYQNGVYFHHKVFFFALCCEQNIDLHKSETLVTQSQEISALQLVVLAVLDLLVFLMHILQSFSLW